MYSLICGFVFPLCVHSFGDDIVFYVSMICGIESSSMCSSLRFIQLIVRRCRHPFVAMETNRVSMQVQCRYGLFHLSAEAGDGRDLG
jgi:hypothetical protein